MIGKPGNLPVIGTGRDSGSRVIGRTVSQSQRLYFSLPCFAIKGCGSFTLSVILLADFFLVSFSIYRDSEYTNHLSIRRTRL